MTTILLRFVGGRSFIDSVLDAVDDFYGDGHDKGESSKPGTRDLRVAVRGKVRSAEHSVVL